MSAENVTEDTADDVIIVDDEEKQETDRQGLIKNVEKLLKTGGKDNDTGGDDGSPDEGKADKPVELTQDELDLAERSGISGELAKSLHEKGLLEETLLSLDQKALAEEPAEKPDDGKETKPKAGDGDADDAKLDPETFDEKLVTVVDSLNKKIADLTAKLEVMGEKTVQVDGWLSEAAGKIDKFDPGEMETLQKAYNQLCKRYGVDPKAKNQMVLDRAYRSLFPDKANKKDQGKKLEKRRDAAGKFIQPTKSSSKSLPARPDPNKSEEERDMELKESVAKYLKRTS